MKTHSFNRAFIVTSLAVCLFLFAGDAVADWAPGGVQVTALGGGDVKIASDGAGGAFIAWTDSRTSQGILHFEQIYLQHITSTGAVAPGWLADGILVSSATASNYRVSDLVPDGFGGALVSWQGPPTSTQGIFATRVLPNGQIQPGWPQAGLKACCANPTFAFDPRLASDGSGGAYLAWTQQEPTGRDVYVQHFTSLGTIAPGWQTDGNPIVQQAGFQSDQHVIPAPGGGLFLAWVSSDGSYLQRVTAGGAIENGWPSSGLKVQNGEISDLNLQPDGNEGSVISGFLFTPTAYVVATRRVSSAAQLDPPVILGSCNGPESCFRRMLVSAFDQSDGVLHAWLDERVGKQVYVGRTLLGPPATPAPGWTANGVRASTAPGNQSYIKFPGVAPDGSGGAFVALDSNEGGVTNVWVQHVRADGSIDSAWGPQGKPILPSPGNRWEPAITATGPGEAIVVWHEGNSGLYAQKLVSEGPPVPTVLSLVDYDVQPGRVSLRWQASDAAFLQATVERSAEGEAWIALGSPRLEGRDLLVYDDESVTPGRFSYRLRYVQNAMLQFSDPVWVEVTAVTRLALGGFQPNPAVVTTAISFSLPDARPASLQVHDVRGRVAFSREVGHLGPGAHVVSMDGLVLATGIYWIRLVRAGETLLAKGVVVR